MEGGGRQRGGHKGGVSRAHVKKGKENEDEGTDERDRKRKGAHGLERERLTRERCRTRSSAGEEIWFVAHAPELDNRVWRGMFSL